MIHGLFLFTVQEHIQSYPRPLLKNEGVVPIYKNKACVTLSARAHQWLEQLSRQSLNLILIAV
jgi:hypothetical protein